MKLSRIVKFTSWVKFRRSWQSQLLRQKWWANWTSLAALHRTAANFTATQLHFRDSENFTEKKREHFLRFVLSFCFNMVFGLALFRQGLFAIYGIILTGKSIIHLCNCMWLCKNRCGCSSHNLLRLHPIVPLPRCSKCLSGLCNDWTHNLQCLSHYWEL